MEEGETDIESILTDLGYTLDDRGDYWQTNAIYRGGDNRTAVQIYKDTGVWKDYVQESGFLPFKALVEKSCEGATKEELNNILKGLGDSVAKKTKKETYKPLELDEVFKEEDLDKLLPHYTFYNKKGISNETLKKFKGGLSTRGQMYQRFIFPVYNEYRQIIGFAGRDMINKEGRPKWKHIGKKTKWVFPLHTPALQDEGGWQNKEIILVESVGDLLSIQENTEFKCLVTFGLGISPALINALVALCPKLIILSSNNDTSSEENRGLSAAIKNYLKLLEFFDPDSIKVCLPTENDFGDMNKKDYNTWTNKLNNIKSKNQSPYILKEAKKLYNKKKMSKALFSKTKFINE
jgi:hypothetical protein